MGDEAFGWFAGAGLPGGEGEFEVVGLGELGDGLLLVAVEDEGQRGSRFGDGEEVGEPVLQQIFGHMVALDLLCIW